MLYILAFIIKQISSYFLELCCTLRMILQRKEYFYYTQKGAASRLRPFQI